MKYGTPEFYKEEFMSWVIDASAEEPECGDALIEGFLLALDEMKQFHQKQVYEYDRLSERIRQA